MGGRVGVAGRVGVTTEGNLDAGKARRTRRTGAETERGTRGRRMEGGGLGVDVVSRGFSDDKGRGLGDGERRSKRRRSCVSRAVLAGNLSSEVGSVEGRMRFCMHST